MLGVSESWGTSPSRIFSLIRVIDATLRDQNVQATATPVSVLISTDMSQEAFALLLVQMRLYQILCMAVPGEVSARAAARRVLNPLSRIFIIENGTSLTTRFSS